MCMFCGGQCGGIGDMLISLGLPLLTLYFFRMKGFLLRMKDKVLGRPPREVMIPEHIETCGCQGGLQPEGSHRLSPVSPTVAVDQLTELAAAAPKGNVTKNPAGENPGGLGGWLLLLCLLLTLIIPALSLYQVNCDLNLLLLPQGGLLLFVWSRASYYLAIGNLVAMAGIAVFSFTSGYRLWARKKGAVQTAKIFLLAQLFLALALLTLQHILMPQPAARNFAVALAVQVIPPILFCSVWYRYLLKSRRVARTFAGKLPETAAAGPPFNPRRGHSHYQKGAAA
jgi:hypothetical protein